MIITVYTANYRPGGEDHRVPILEPVGTMQGDPKFRQWGSLVSFGILDWYLLPSHPLRRTLLVLGSHPEPTYHYLLRLVAHMTFLHFPASNPAICVHLL